MNKLQFLAELNQYLTFFTLDERAKIIADYTQKIDAIGEEGEEKYLAELGTPMMVAIDLKRRKEAGQLPTDEYGEVLLSSAAACQDAVNKYSVETISPEQLEEEEQTVPPPEEALDAPLQLDEPEVSVRRVSAIGIIGASLLSLVISAVFLAVACPGALALIGGSYLLMAGLQSVYYLADALLLFCGGLAGCAVGLLVVWFALWCAISLVAKLFRRALGRKGKSDLLKKIWKVMGIIVLSLLAAGVVCGVVAWLMGGTIDGLYQNKVAAPVLEMLDPIKVLNAIYDFLGL